MSANQDTDLSDRRRATLGAACILLSPLVIYFIARILPSVIPDLKDRPAAWCTFEFVTSRPDECKEPKKAGIQPVVNPDAANQNHGGTVANTAVTPSVTALMLGTARKPKTLDQARTLELALRLGFETASNLLRLTSILVLVGATAFYFSRDYTRRLWPVVGLLIVVIGCALAGVHFLSQDALTENLIVGAIQNAQSQLLKGNGVESFWMANKINLFLGFAASGALLAMLTSLVWRTEDHAGAMVALQFAIAMGAALFSAASYANPQAVAWAKGLIDDNTMSFAASALDLVPLYWGVIGSISLATVGGLTYIFVSNDDQPSDANGSAFALRTSDGSDLKFFGWLVNAILALSPIYTALKIPTTPLF